MSVYPSSYVLLKSLKIMFDVRLLSPCTDSSQYVAIYTHKNTLKIMNFEKEVGTAIKIRKQDGNHALASIGYISNGLANYHHK